MTAHNFESACDRAADCAFALLLAEPAQRLRLAYRPAHGNLPGELLPIPADLPLPRGVADSGVPLTGSMTWTRMAHVIAQTARRLPIMAEAA